MNSNQKNIKHICYCLIIVFALIILWRIRKSDKEFASEYSLHSVKS